MTSRSPIGISETPLTHQDFVTIYARTAVNFTVLVRHVQDVMIKPSRRKPIPYVTIVVNAMYSKCPVVVKQANDIIDFKALKYHYDAILNK